MRVLLGEGEKWLVDRIILKQSGLLSRSEWKKACARAFYHKF
jgi:hypothetical protein